MALGENMKQLRTSQGLTLEDVALYANITRQAVYKFENNQMNPQPEVLLRIAEKLGVTCEELICGKSKNKHPET